jgi:hypothetical protein
MILLDTDHVTLLKYPKSDRCARLRQRLEAVPAEEVIAVSVIVVEEQMRGWLATIARERSARRQFLRTASSPGCSSSSRSSRSSRSTSRRLTSSNNSGPPSYASAAWT